MVRPSRHGKIPVTAFTCPSRSFTDCSGVMFDIAVCSCTSTPRMLVKLVLRYVAKFSRSVACVDTVEVGVSAVRLLLTPLIAVTSAGIRLAVMHAHQHNGTTCEWSAAVVMAVAMRRGRWCLHL